MLQLCKAALCSPQPGQCWRHPEGVLCCLPPPAPPTKEYCHRQQMSSPFRGKKVHLWPVAAKNSILVYCYRIFACPYTCTFLERWISKVKTFLSSTPCSSRNITNRNISLQKTCIFMDIKEVNTIPFQVGKKGEKKKKKKCIFGRQIQTKNRIIRIFIIASMIYCTLSMYEMGL